MQKGLTFKKLVICFLGLFLLGMALTAILQNDKVKTSNQSTTQTTPSIEPAVARAPAEHDDAPAAITPGSSLISSPSRKEHTSDFPNFNYAEESQQIFKLEKNFPRSKPELIKIIVSPDRFQVENKKVEPHTNNEITQRQMGALKVLALKVLMTNETSKGTLSKDLQSIIQAAQTTTMKNIATAALDSHEKGRNFFPDSVNAISHLGK